MSVGRRRNPLRRIALAAASVVVVLGVLELGMRVRCRVVGTPWDADATERELAKTLAARLPSTGRADPESAPSVGLQSDAVALHPYLGFDAPLMREQLAQAVGASRRPDGFDVFVTGGSVAASFVDAGSSRMTEALGGAPDSPQRVVRVWREGREAFKQPQQANALAYALSQGVEPEFVVVIDGAEDLAITAQNDAAGTYPLYPWASRWLALASNPASEARTLDRMIELRARQRHVVAFARRALDWRLAQSALAGSLVVARMAALRSEADAAERELEASLDAFRDGPAERGPKFSGDANQTLRRAAEAWTEGARSMWGLCRERGIPYLHVLQPCLHDADSKPLTDDERARATVDAATIDAVRRGYPVLRARGAELARQGMPFLDASQLFAATTETRYLDDFRLDDTGLERLGTAIGERMRAELAQRAK